MTPVGAISEREKRELLCRKLGLGNIVQAHQFISAAALNGPNELLRKNVRARDLLELGYTAEALRKLGFGLSALDRLGFDAPDARVKSDPNLSKHFRKPMVRSREGGASVAVTKQLQELLDAGMRVEGLLARGYNAVICKKAGLSASDLTQLGFDLHQLRGACSLPELRRAGYNARDLRRYFSGADLRQAGFPSGELRLAGFSARELLMFGYAENAVVTAGYSITELADAGLSKRVVDKRGFQ